MNNTYKKIIAKEYLILLISAISFFIILSVWIKLSDDNAEKREELKNEIELLDISYNTFQSNFYNEDLDSLYNVIHRRNLYHESLSKFKVDMTSKSQQIELYKLLLAKNIYIDTQNKFLEKYFTTKEVLITEILRDYVRTANSPLYNSDWNTINSVFPELQKINKEMLREYVATANNPQNKNDWNMINSKFPELIYSDINKENLEKFNELNFKLQIKEKSIFKHRLSESEIFDLILVVILLLYGLRCLIYSTKWSLRQLKN